MQEWDNQLKAYCAGLRVEHFFKASRRRPACRKGMVWQCINEVLALLTIRDNKGHLLIGKRFGEKVFSEKLRLVLVAGKDFGECIA